MAIPSNNAVNRLLGSAQGSFTARTPCSLQSLRGGCASESYGTGRCPDGATAILVDDHKAGTVGHSPGTANPGRSHARDGRAPRPQTASVRLVRPATAIEYPGWLRRVLGPAIIQHAASSPLDSRMGHKCGLAVLQEVARDFVESQRLSVLISYATAAAFAIDFWEPALAIDEINNGICRNPMTLRN